MPESTAPGEVTPSYCFVAPASCIPPPSAALTPEESTAFKTVQDGLPALLDVQTDLSLRVKEKAWASDNCLKRYLRANKWNATNALKALGETLVWRRDYHPDNLSISGMEEEGNTGKTFHSGFDCTGRPIIYMRPRMQNTQESDRQIEYVVWVLERAIASMPRGVETVTLVIDYKGASMRQGPGLRIAKLFLHILGHHYPERLGRAFICEGPWWFFTGFKVISPLIDPVTRSKIWFVDLAKQQKMIEEDAASPEKAAARKASSKGNMEYANLHDHIDPAQLDIGLGGTARADYAHEVYWPALLAATGNPTVNPSWEASA